MYAIIIITLIIMIYVCREQLAGFWEYYTYMYEEIEQAIKDGLFVEILYSYFP